MRTIEMQVCVCQHEHLQDRGPCCFILGYMKFCHCQYPTPERKLFVQLFIKDGRAYYEIGYFKWHFGGWVRHIMVHGGRKAEI